MAQALPGIPSNVLSSRLRELEEADLVHRSVQARPSTVVVYALTPYGRELEEPVVRLGLWGAKSLARPKRGDSFSVAALSVALRGVFDPTATRGRKLVAELRFDHSRLYVVVDNGQVAFPAEPPDPDLVLSTPPDVFAELFAGYTDVDAAIAADRVRIDGSTRDARVASSRSSTSRKQRRPESRASIPPAAAHDQPLRRRDRPVVSCTTTEPVACTRCSSASTTSRPTATGLPVQR